MMLGNHTKIVLLLSINSLMLNFGCASSKKSDRDTRQEQIRNNAAIKRSELTPITGVYTGTINAKSTPEKPKQVTLDLNIQDMPHEEGNQVDPILIPNLAGSLSFRYGDSLGGTNEVIVFAVKKATYDPKSTHLDLLLENSKYKSMQLDLKWLNGRLQGTWLAPNSSVSGDASLTKDENSAIESANKPPRLSGTYKGDLSEASDNSTSKPANIIIKSIPAPPDSIAFEAALQVFLTEYDSEEYVSYTFEDVEFNPITEALTFNGGKNSPISLSGSVENGVFVGSWSTPQKDDAGSIRFTRQSSGTISGDTPDESETTEQTPLLRSSL